MQYTGGESQRIPVTMGGSAMARSRKFGKRPDKKPNLKDTPLRSRLGSGQDVYRREGNIRIAPKHPGMGRH